MTYFETVPHYVWLLRTKIASKFTILSWDGEEISVCYGTRRFITVSAKRAIEPYSELFESTPYPPALFLYQEF